MQEPVDTRDTPKRRSRRTYTKEFKAQLVAQCNLGEKSIAQLSMDHQINANLIHKWTRQLSGTDKQEMLPVKVIALSDNADSSNRVEVSIGQTTIRFYGVVDAQSAKVVLELLR